MNRGEVWTAFVGGKHRPVLVLTRDGVIDVRAKVCVAEITTEIRGISAEVGFDWADLGLSEPSVVNLDGLHTIAKRHLSTRVGQLDQATMHACCQALTYAVGC